MAMKGGFGPLSDEVFQGLLELYLGCWLNVSKRPVLKHGPRSLPKVRVFGCQTHMRNESE